MTYRPDQLQDEFQDQVPQALAEDLGALFGPVQARVPAQRDQRILASAHAAMAGRNRYRLLRRWGAAAAAVAAVVLLAIVLMPEWGRQSQQAVNPQTIAPTRVADAKDLNTDGSVDILDAYLLAKRIDRMEALDKAMDFNADGMVDRSDANVLAAAAVELKGGIQ